MSNRQVRALCYAALFVMVAIDWTAVGAALFMAAMDFICGSLPSPTEEEKGK